MIVFLSRKCKSKVLPIDFLFISVYSSPETKFKGTKASKELPSKLQVQSKFIKIHFPLTWKPLFLGLMNPGDSSVWDYLLSNAPTPPTPTFFFLPSVLACKPCCFNFFPVLPVLLEHFIFDSQLIWRSATLRFNCL